MEKIDTAIGKSIRHYRWLQGIPLADLAAALGISEAQMRSHEAGKSRISAARLMDISQHLGVEVTAFFKRKTDAAPAATQSEPYASRGPSEALQNGKYLATLITHFQRLDEAQKQAIVHLVASMAKDSTADSALPVPQGLLLVKAKPAVLTGNIGLTTMGADIAGGRDGP